MFQPEFQPEQYSEESTTERDERIARWNENAAGFIQGQIDKQAERIEELEEAMAAIARLCSGEDQPPDNEQADCTEDTLLEIEKIAKHVRHSNIVLTLKGQAERITGLEQERDEARADVKSLEAGIDAQDKVLTEKYNEAVAYAQKAARERDEARRRVTELELAYNNVVIRRSWMEAYQRERKLRLDGERERDEARGIVSELKTRIQEMFNEIVLLRDQLHELKYDRIELRGWVRNAIAKPLDHSPIKCEHGIEYWDVCESCIDEYFEALLKGKQ